jgi:hypothetical protein
LRKHWQLCHNKVLGSERRSAPPVGVQKVESSCGTMAVAGFITFFIIACYYWNISISALSADPLSNSCVNCVDGFSTGSCPSPEHCGYHPILNCTNCPAIIINSTNNMNRCESCNYLGMNKDSGCSSSCMGGMSMPGCLLPGSCGLPPLNCYGCSKIRMDSNIFQSECPTPAECALGGSYPCINCIDSVPTSSCPDPGVCGYQSIACSGCIPQQLNGAIDKATCSHPEYCVNHVFPSSYDASNTCVNCMDMVRQGTSTTQQLRTMLIV